MSTSYERTFRAEVLKECLAGVAGKLLRTGTKKGKTLAIEAGVLANKLLDPEYDNDEALDEAYKEYENYKRLYEELKKGV
jgi:hypothetical protein